MLEAFPIQVLSWPNLSPFSEGGHQLTLWNFQAENRSRRYLRIAQRGDTTLVSRRETSASIEAAPHRYWPLWEGEVQTSQECLAQLIDEFLAFRSIGLEQEIPFDPEYLDGVLYAVQIQTNDEGILYGFGINGQHFCRDCQRVTKRIETYLGKKRPYWEQWKPPRVFSLLYRKLWTFLE